MLIPIKTTLSIFFDANPVYLGLRTKLLDEKVHLDEDELNGTAKTCFAKERKIDLGVYPRRTGIHYLFSN